MSERRYHPARMFAARCVYWAIWGPPLAVALPFVLIGWAFDYCADRLFPRVARRVQPAWAFTHELALRAGNAVLGFRIDASLSPNKEPSNG